jgi:dTDP-4-dehydrorhamnose reductase
LGHRLYMDLSKEKEFQVFATVRGELPSHLSALFGEYPGTVLSGVDVLVPDKLEVLVDELRPDYVINAVGLIKQHKCLATEMIRLNSWLPWHIQQILQKKGGRFIHFSTDCVFRGDQGNYAEQVTPDVTDIYGRSKALGEIADQTNTLCLRTSIIGRELKNHLSLVDWFLGQPVGAALHGYQGAIYTGLPTHSVAKFLVNVIKLAPELSGLYHLSSDPISKYDLLCRIRERASLDVTIDPVTEPRIDRSLCSDKLRGEVGFAIPHNWDDLLDDLFVDFDHYDKWSARGVACT